MKIGIFGCGAVGSAIAVNIYNYFPKDIYILALKERYKRYQNGIIVNDKKYNIQCTDTEKMDYIFLCIKNYNLNDIIDDLKIFCNDDTRIIPLLNGITATPILSKHFKYVYYGCINIESNKENDKVETSRILDLKFGHDFNEIIAEDILKISNFLKECQIPHQIPLDMKRSIWLKWMLNMGINQVSALARASYKEMQHPNLKEMIYACFTETVKVGTHIGIDISEDDADEVLARTYEWTSDRTTSLAFDFIHQKENELEVFSGELLRLAKQSQIECPINTFIYKFLKAISDNYQK